eukprot:jgi/Mesvir1/14346/Mv09754-RA.1
MKSVWAALLFTVCFLATLQACPLTAPVLPDRGFQVVPVKVVETPATSSCLLQFSGADGLYDPKTWLEANSICNAIGFIDPATGQEWQGYLAWFTSDLERTDLLSTVRNRTVFWIGGKQPPEVDGIQRLLQFYPDAPGVGNQTDKEAQWYWTSGAPWRSDYWCTGQAPDACSNGDARQCFFGTRQPNDAFYDEDCAEMYPDYINDQNCYLAYVHLIIISCFVWWSSYSIGMLIRFGPHMLHYNAWLAYQCGASSAHQSNPFQLKSGHPSLPQGLHLHLCPAWGLVSLTARRQSAPAGNCEDRNQRKFLARAGSVGA